MENGSAHRLLQPLDHFDLVSLLAGILVPTAHAMCAAFHMHLQEIWAVRFGLLTDRFGIPWAINCEKSA